MFIAILERNKGREIARLNALQGAEKRESEAKALRERAAQFGPVEPSEHAIRVAAFLAHCADTTTNPTHQNALRAGYPCTGAALAAGLSDALAMRWVGQLAPEKGGGLYWRDQGSTPDCPLVVWGDRFKK
jgi:hypothetical protein